MPRTRQFEHLRGLGRVKDWNRLRRKLRHRLSMFARYEIGYVRARGEIVSMSKVVDLAAIRSRANASFK